MVDAVVAAGGAKLQGDDDEELLVLGGEGFHGALGCHREGRGGGEDAEVRRASTLRRMEREETRSFG